MTKPAVMPDNLVFADEQPRELIFWDKIHATNGTYMYDAAKIVPTMLAGFEYISENHVEDPYRETFVIAANSDKSMKQIMWDKGASKPETDAVEDQRTRALKVAYPLALQHPDHMVVVMYYDEKTPNALYDSLAAMGIEQISLHKWDCGTNEDAPRIEGAEHSSMVFGFPLPNDEKAVCHDITPIGGQRGTVNVVKLTEENCAYGVPYISPEGKIQFPVRSRELEKYTQSYANQVAHAAKVEAQLAAAPAPSAP